MTERTTTTNQAPEPHEPAASPPTVDVATPGDDRDRVGALARLAAYLVDALILVALIYVVADVLRALIGPTLRIVDVDGVSRIMVDRVHSVVNAVAATAVTGAYFVGSWLRFGGTPGQRLIRARVEPADGTTPRLGVGQAVARWLLLGTPIGLIGTLLGPPSAVGLIPVVVIAIWDAILLVTTIRGKRKRGLHDRIAGTVVRRVAPAAS